MLGGRMQGRKMLVKRYKKLAVVLAIWMALTVGLTGCDGASDKENTAGKGNTTDVTATTDIASTTDEAATADAASEVKEEPTATPAAEKSADQNLETAKDGADKDADKTADEKKEEPAEETFVSDRSAVFELLSNMNVGWNLGNTFDAHGAGNSLRSETYWGNPETTKAMIDAVAAQGFNTIRIPVTWAEHVGFPPNYTIDKKWLDRVQTVVDYAVANDMYIIINTHHEPDFWMTTKPEKKDKVKEELVAIWTQVAERFKNYNEKLLFEGMNENRIKGSEKEWSGGTPEERAVINELNLAFVDAVRATGGNNATRVLIISPYGNNAGKDAMKDLEIPKDNNIAVALHMYTPYVFTYEAAQGNITTWDGSKKGDIAASLRQVSDVLIKKDVPVIVTEFGAVNKGNEGEVLKWIADYMQQMNKYGVKCIWWDNGNYTNSGEKFAIFDRRNLKWYSKKTADALINNSVTGLQEE